MNFCDYEIDVEGAIKSIQKNNWKTILLQLPEGLKTHAETLVEYIAEKIPEVTCLVASDPCYGACDLPCSSHLQSLGVDVVVHIGHTPIPSMQVSQDVAVLFLNAKSKKPVIPVVTKALPFLTGKNIGVVTTAQHLHMLSDVVEVLQDNGFKPFIGTGDKRIFEPGQILGCNFSSARTIQSSVDSYLFVGSGFFHPLGLILSTNKEVVAADPYTDTVKKTELNDVKDRVLRQRYGAITQAKMAKTYGILVGLKPGQQRIKQALQLQKTIQEKGRKALLLTVDYISPMILQNFPSIDCFVSTICPRVAIDDHLQYKQTIVTPVELDIAFGKKRWDTYVFDEIF